MVKIPATRIYVFEYGDAVSAAVITMQRGLGSVSSNPEWHCVHFILG